MYQEVQKLFHLWPFHNFEQSVYSGNHASKNVEKKRKKNRKRSNNVFFFNVWNYDKYCMVRIWYTSDIFKFVFNGLVNA